jgi:nucleotide-binding universal stress UspA family protein
MKSNILLAIDATPDRPFQHFSGTLDVLSGLVRDGADHVIVLHIREFSLPHLVRTMRDSGDASGRLAVDDIVASLRAAGIHASGQVLESDFGHVARMILDAAVHFDARLIVLGSRDRTDLARIPVGGVATHLLRISTLPVLIVPPPDSPRTSRKPASITAQFPSPESVKPLRNHS